MTMTNTAVLTISEFLLARIAEDEELARGAVGRHWCAQGGPELRTDSHDSPGVTEPCWFQIARGGSDCGPHGYRSDEYRLRMASFRHIAQHDPARILAECAAKRAIMGRHSRWDPTGDYCPGEDGRYLLDDCPTLRALASVYADHPDYRDEWRTATPDATG